MTERKPLAYYLGLTYPYTVMPDEDSFFIEFPDLPNCITQVESSDEIAHAAEEIRALWIETEYEAGEPIPEPTPHTGYSGKFIVRVPRSLHRDLATAAKRQNVSLNAYVTALLAERNLAARVNAGLKKVEALVVESGQSATCRPPGDDREQPRREHVRKSAAD